MQSIQHRLDTLHHRTLAARQQGVFPPGLRRLRRQLSLIQAEHDAIQQILDEITPGATTERGRDAIEAEFDAALTRLEASFDRAVRRAQRRTGQSHAPGMTPRRGVGAPYPPPAPRADLLSTIGPPGR